MPQSTLTYRGNVWRIRKRILGKESQWGGPGVGGNGKNSEMLSTSKAKRAKLGKSPAETWEDLRVLS